MYRFSDDSKIFSSFFYCSTYLLIQETKKEKGSVMRLTLADNHLGEIEQRREKKTGEF